MRQIRYLHGRAVHPPPKIDHHNPQTPKTKLTLPTCGTNTTKRRRRLLTHPLNIGRKLKQARQLRPPPSGRRHRIRPASPIFARVFLLLSLLLSLPKLSLGGSVEFNFDLIRWIGTNWLDVLRDRAVVDPARARFNLCVIWLDTPLVCIRCA